MIAICQDLLEITWDHIGASALPPRISHRPHNGDPARPCYERRGPLAIRAGVRGTRSELFGTLQCRVCSASHIQSYPVAVEGRNLQQTPPRGPCPSMTIGDSRTPPGGRRHHQGTATGFVLTQSDGQSCRKLLSTCSPVENPQVCSQAGDGRPWWPGSVMTTSPATSKLPSVGLGHSHSRAKTCH